MSRAILLTKQVPWPVTSGGRMREAQVACMLRRCYDEVHVLGFGEQPRADEVPDGVQVHAVDRPDVLRGALLARSTAVGRWYSGALRRHVDELLEPGVHLHVGFPHMVVNVRPAERVDSLDLHNVESDLLAQRARRHPRAVLRPLLALEARRLAAWERVVTRTPFVTCVTEQDRVRLAALGIPATVARNGAAVPETATPPHDDEAVVFIGALDWAPNAESAAWFRHQVWPRVRQRRPGAVAAVVGRAPGAGVLALQGDGLVVAGDVLSVTPWYDRSRLAVAPLLTGGGSRLKIIEALAHGRPVVSTPLGAEGLEDLVGSGVVLATEPDDFAAAVASLLADPAACAELGAAGRAAVQRDWSWSGTLAPLEAAVCRR